MKETYNDTENLIARHFDGECSEVETATLLAWVNESDKNKSEFIALKDLWDSSRRIADHTEVQLAKFYKEQYFRSRKSRMLFVRSAVAVAAVLLLALVINIFLPTTSEKSIDGYQVVTVPLGSRSKVTLADGTEINLNSGSELTYANSYTSQNRNVTLSGEAFFQVKSDAKHPFLVKTKNFDIRVTGTRFNVCAYSEDVLASTTLAEGKSNLHLHHLKQEFVL
ncbi:MAG: FecR family protein [Prolixibacteraceae bacterium]